MATGPGGLVCPKCQGQMRTYERSGIHVDQCGECRGVFLDRGELDRLIDAESSYLESAAPHGAPASQAPQALSWGSLGGGHPGGGHSGGHSGGHHRRRKGLLGELFD